MIFISASTHTRPPEVEISGKRADLFEFGRQLLELSKSTRISLPKADSRFYPLAMQSLNLEVAKPGDGRISMMLDESSFSITGSIEAFGKLGSSIMGVFQAETFDGQHIHLDYFEGDDLIAEANCSVIISAIDE